MTPSATCESLTQSFEHCSLVAYHGEADSPNVWTIGWGETIGVTEGMTCTQDWADTQLLSDLMNAGLVVSRYVDVAINQNQFDALCDFVYNEGSGNFAGSTLLKRLNAGDFAGASAQFLVWDYADGRQVDGLERRRKAEQTLFNA
jgi:lysozyme